MSGESAYSIARSFNAEGIQPPAARTWSSTTVAKMLRNPRYAGMVSYAGKHRVQAATAGDGWSLVLFDDEGRPLLGSWEPIITPKLWPQVRFEWQRRRQKAGIKPGEIAISAPAADTAVEEAMNAFLRRQFQASQTGLDQSAGTLTALQSRFTARAPPDARRRTLPPGTSARVGPAHPGRANRHRASAQRPAHRRRRVVHRVPSHSQQRRERDHDARRTGGSSRPTARPALAGSRDILQIGTTFSRRSALIAPPRFRRGIAPVRPTTA